MNVRPIGFVAVLTFGLPTSCVSTNTGGLIDLKADGAPSVKLKFEEIRWNSPPLIEFGVRKGDQLGYYSRPEDLEGDIDALQVYDLEENLLYTVTVFIDEEGRELLIDGPGGEKGSIRSPYAPSSPHRAELQYPDEAYSLFFGYARKGGAEGYRHKQWIVSRDGVSLVIHNTRDNVDGNVQTEILVSESFLRDGDDVLLWSALGLLMFEIDQIDRNREVQVAAMDYLMDEAKEDSGLKLF